MKFMKCTAFLLGLSSFAAASRLVRRQDYPRNESILIDPPEQPSLPTKGNVSESLPADDIQGDILIGMKKKLELFWFFRIEDPNIFKQALHNDIWPIITTTTQLLSISTQPLTAVNLAFSQPGLQALNINDPLNDADFESGHFANAANDFHDQYNEWVDAFLGQYIHGVFLLASDDQALIDQMLNDLLNVLQGSVTEIYRLQGSVRPGSQVGHEHFGFMDGIRHVEVCRFGSAVPGQITVPPGEILLGESGDPVGRPSWAKDGSFLVFRQLKQFVPEFNKFTTDNPIIMNGMTIQEGREFMGARMMGRWKSGAPLSLSPVQDDLVLAQDSQSNNNFDFTEQDAFNRCPFSSHIRKTNPRIDVGNGPFNRIMRAGIPYGPEVTATESKTNTSSTKPELERGLAFVAYQSVIAEGFKFIEQRWVNEPNFAVSNIGLDPIIGTNGGGPNFVQDLEPFSQATTYTIQKDFVLSRGGEYFFSPSISALRDVISV